MFRILSTAFTEWDLNTYRIILQSFNDLGLNPAHLKTEWVAQGPDQGQPGLHLPHPALVIQGHWLQKAFAKKHLAQYKAMTP